MGATVDKSPELREPSRQQPDSSGHGLALWLDRLDGVACLV